MLTEVVVDSYQYHNLWNKQFYNDNSEQYSATVEIFLISKGMKVQENKFYLYSCFNSIKFEDIKVGQQDIA